MHVTLPGEVSGWKLLFNVASLRRCVKFLNMKNKFDNGNGKFKTVSDFEGKEIDFPVTFHLKTVMEGIEKEENHKDDLVQLFELLKINYVYQSKKISSKGAYISFTYEITLVSKKQMNDLYAGLGKIKAIKFAV